MVEEGISSQRRALQSCIGYMLNKLIIFILFLPILFLPSLFFYSSVLLFPMLLFLLTPCPPPPPPPLLIVWFTKTRLPLVCTLTTSDVQIQREQVTLWLPSCLLLWDHISRGEEKGGDGRQEESGERLGWKKIALIGPHHPQIHHYFICSLTFKMVRDLRLYPSCDSFHWILTVHRTLIYI